MKNAYHCLNSNWIQYLLSLQACVHYWRRYWKRGEGKTKKPNDLQTEVLISAWTATRNVTEWHEASSLGVAPPHHLLSASCFHRKRIKIEPDQPPTFWLWTPNLFPHHSFCLPPSATTPELKIKPLLVMGSVPSSLSGSITLSCVNSYQNLRMSAPRFPLQRFT